MVTHQANGVMQSNRQSNIQMAKSMKTRKFVEYLNFIKNPTFHTNNFKQEQIQAMSFYSDPNTALHDFNNCF